ncbi:MAG: hypothetical protein NTX04_00785 [Verrucomicrobia bacterium]|nr:hypothetical protein [Verrucomicrobiota bacterium]
MFGSSRKHFADAQSAQRKIQRNQFQDEIIRRVLEAFEQSQNLTNHLVFARDFLATDAAKLQLKNRRQRVGIGVALGQFEAQKNLALARLDGLRTISARQGPVASPPYHRFHSPLKKLLPLRS